MPDETSIRLAHGFTISTTLPMGGMIRPADGSIADIEVYRLEGLPGPSVGMEPVLGYEFSDGRSIVAVRDQEGSVLVDFSDMARFLISPDSRRISVDFRTDADESFALVLLEGWVMSMALMLRGAAVFHATAVEVDGTALGLLGHSGMGKSTIAAMLCRDGASLISDDVLRVDRLDPSGWVAFPGLTSIRLRPAAADLAELIPGADSLLTADGRIAARVHRSDPLPVGLSAMLIPVPSRSATEVRVDWLSPSLAAFELNAYPRVFEWKISDPVRSHFQIAAGLASSIPVGFLVVPWGPPWWENLLDTVAALVDQRMQ